MAEQHHELAHVFTDPLQAVNDARDAAARDLNTPYTFPNYTKPEWTEKAAVLTGWNLPQTTNRSTIATTQFNNA